MLHRLIIVFFVFLFAGCGQHRDHWLDERPATLPASGTVSFEGQLIEGADVVFTLIDGSRSASGITAKGGSFTLTTFSPGDGAVAGTYRVRVSKVEIQGKTKVDDNDSTPSTVKLVSHLPDRYGDIKTSKLTAEISKGSLNEFNFQLSK